MTQENTTKTISVVIPTYRRLDMLKRCLDGVILLTPAVEQIIVVYRPDEDKETSDWLNAVGGQYRRKLKLVPVYVSGQVAALNAGIDNADSDYVVILDDDAIPHENWLTLVLAHFSRSNVAAVGGRDIVHAGVVFEPSSIAGIRTWWGDVIGNHHTVEGEPRDVDVIKGCNLALRRSALGTLRFDGRLLGKGAQVCNDLWFCLCLRNSGWIIVLDPRAKVDHYPAMKVDYIRNQFTKTFCYEATFNEVATKTAYLAMTQRIFYFLYFWFIGRRTCPGLYFIAHSLVKRPCSIWGQITGGWLGFIRGWKIASKFRQSPPGQPNLPSMKAT